MFKSDYQNSRSISKKLPKSLFRSNIYIHSGQMKRRIKQNRSNEKNIEINQSLATNIDLCFLSIQL